MSSPAPISRQIRSEQLWPELRQLAASLWTAGLTSSRLHAVWRSSVVVSCDACGTRWSEHDLLAVLDLPEGAEPPPGRLVRLSQGYCLKPSCESRFFRITLAPNDDIDWARFLAAPGQPAASAQSAKTPSTKAPPEETKTRPLASGKTRLALAIVGLLVALLVRHWYLHGRVPFFNQTFKAAPLVSETGVPDTRPPGAVAPRASTNGFRVAP
jgi:hypothetical protein